MTGTRSCTTFFLFFFYFILVGYHRVNWEWKQQTANSKQKSQTIECLPFVFPPIIAHVLVEDTYSFCSRWTNKKKKPPKLKLFVCKKNAWRECADWALLWLKWSRRSLLCSNNLIPTHLQESKAHDFIYLQMEICIESLSRNYFSFPHCCGCVIHHRWFITKWQKITF